MSENNQEIEKMGKCEACGNKIEKYLLYTLTDDWATYIVCLDCLDDLINCNLEPDQWKRLIKNGHSEDEFLLHGDFYNENGNAVQPNSYENAIYDGINIHAEWMQFAIDKLIKTGKIKDIDIFNKITDTIKNSNPNEFQEWKNSIDELLTENEYYAKLKELKKEVNFNCYVKLIYSDYIQLFDKWNPYKNLFDPYANGLC